MLVSVITSNEYGKVQEIRYASDNSGSVTEAIRFNLLGTGGVTGRWKSTDYDDPVAQMIAEAGELPGWTDFRTVKDYEVYFEAGLDTLFIQENDAYNGPNATGLANLKETMAKAKQAGITKVIVSDRRLTNASRLTHSILAAPTSDADILLYKQFFNVWDNSSVNRAHTDAEVLNAVKAILKEYMSVDNFYGVQLADEPNYQNIAYYAEIYGYIQRAFNELKAEGTVVKTDKIFIQACLLGSGYTDIEVSDLVSPQRFAELVTQCGGDKSEAHKMAYSEYVATFFTNSNAEQIIIDSYVVNHDRNSATVDAEHPYYVSEYHFYTLAEIARQAKANGASIGGVALSTEYLSWRGYITHPEPNEAFMYYQLNAYMMFGAKSIGYYTYWAKTGSGANQHPDGSSFIGRDGEPTEMYPIYQRLNAETLNLAKFMNGFSYNSYKYFVSGETSDYLARISDGQAQSFAKLSGITVDSGKEVLVTELTNDNGKYMYAVMNTEMVDFPDDAVVTGNDVTVTLNLNGAGSEVSVFFDGVESKLDVANDSVILTIPAGHAYYVIVG